MFTDESRFYLKPGGGRVRVWRHLNERYHIDLTFFRGRLSVAALLWFGLAFLWGHTELHIVENGSMNAERYISDILEDYRMPFAPYVGD